MYYIYQSQTFEYLGVIHTGWRQLIWEDSFHTQREAMTRVDELMKITGNHQADYNVMFWSKITFPSWVGVAA